MFINAKMLVFWKVMGKEKFEVSAVDMKSLSEDDAPLLLIVSHHCLMNVESGS